MLKYMAAKNSVNTVVGQREPAGRFYVVHYINCRQVPHVHVYKTRLGVAPATYV